MSLALDGVRQPYPQDVTLTPTDPLTLSVAPLTDRSVQVHVANAAETAFSGSLSLAPGAALARQPVHLTAGQTGVDVTLPADPRRGVGLLLGDTRGRLIARLPMTRFVPYAVALPALRAVLDGDLKVPSTTRLDPASAPPGGVSALLLDYKFAPGWSFVRVTEGPPVALPGRPLGLGLWVYGDGSGNLARMRFRDATRQTLQVNGLPVDWWGWRFVSFRLVVPPGQSADLGHWGGANDGHVHYPVTVVTLFLFDSRPDALRHQGMLWIKQPMVLHGAAK